MSEISWAGRTSERPMARSLLYLERDKYEFEAEILVASMRCERPVKMMLNSSEFYGQGFSAGNLELLARFYEKYPDYVDKTFSQAFVMGAPKCKPEELRQSVDNCIAALRGTKKIDLCQPARIDVILPFAHRYIPSPSRRLRSAPCLLATAAELDIAIAAYSPLAHGMTTGKIKSVEDFPAGSRYRDMTRIKDENWEYNKRLVDALVAMAAEKKCTPAQLSIAWVGALGEKVIPLPGSSKKERTLENLYAADIELTKEDLDKIAKIMETNPVRGDRAFGPQVEMRLWG
ncbi:NADP-dependent oxidoreductase domain-containing protein [Earliella scabrosa]|nr:NADP-dependent oxidoreductase domain-containing protein [Earliella scabrosa]